MLESLQQVQTIQIGTEFYQLVEVAGEHSRLAWEETFEDESAFQGGTPNILSAPADTWHMGGLKSREGFPGTSEYGQNTDGRWPNRLIPGPEWTEIVLTDSSSSPTGFFEAFGRLFVVTSTKIFRIDPADDSVVLSKTITDIAKEGVEWEGVGIVGAITSGPIGSKLYRVTALGTPDTWDDGTAAAYRVAVGLDRIFKVDHTGLLKNCLTGLDPTDENNWSDEVQCGDPNRAPNALVAYERTALVGKPDGLFGVNAEGKGIPLIKRMPYDSYNCLGMYVVEPHVLVPTRGGTFRYTPGLVELVGLEQELLNESPVQNHFRTLVSDGLWTYGSIWQGSDSYILVSRSVRQGESSFGPYIWDTLSFISGASSWASHVSRLWDPPRIWLDHGADVAYAELSPGGSPYRYVTAGVRYTHRYHFGDWRDKDFLKVDAVGRGCDTNTYWKIHYSVDGGDYSDKDIDNVEMRVDENKLHTFTLPTTAKGREVQFKLEYVGAADDAMGQLVHFKPYAVPASLKLRHYNLTLHLADELRHDGGVEQRTSVQQLNDLYALTEDPAGVDCKGPWGDITIHPKKMRMLEARQEGHALPRFLVEFVGQKREA